MAPFRYAVAYCSQYSVRKNCSRVYIAATAAKHAVTSVSFVMVMNKDRRPSLSMVLVICMLCLALPALLALMIWIGLQRASETAVMASAALASTAMISPSMTSPETCPDSIAVLLPAELDSLRASLLAEASRAHAVSWTTYAGDTARYAGRRVVLRQADFDGGTLRITTPGVFVLAENVTFSPNAAHDFRPNLPAQAALYGGAAYRLGFFAAIAVESPNVVIDLHGHTLDASPVFCAEQKFYAHIEVADQPFLAGQGPTNFGDENLAADGLVIENGTLGSTPHHGIHGNGARRVLIQDVTLRDYEVAAVALNGARDVVLRRVRALGSSRHVAVLGTYSQARILLLMAQRLIASTDAAAVTARSLVQNAIGPLAALVAQVRADVAATGRIDETAHPEAAALFANDAGMNDGNSYGVVFHPRGAAVQSFWHLVTPSLGSDVASERIYLEDCRINGTQGRIVEVVALVAPNGMPVRGPAGDVVRIRDNIDRIRLYSGPDTGTGPLVGGGGNALSRAQAAFIAGALSFAAADPGNTARLTELFGTSNGDEHAVAFLRGERTLADLVTQHGYTYQRNGDSMFHVNKGVVGLRIDGSRDVCLHGVSVRNTVNFGLPGVTRALPGEPDDETAAYTGSTDGGHPGQGKQYGYLGADARGISLAATATVHVDKTSVDGVQSMVGNARGLDVFNGANETHAGAGCAFSRISTLQQDNRAVAVGEYTMGYKVGQAIGVRVSAGSAHGGMYGLAAVHVSNVVSRVFEQAVFMAMDATPEDPSLHLTEAEQANVYGLPAVAQEKKK